MPAATAAGVSENDNGPRLVGFLKPISPILAIALLLAAGAFAILWFADGDTALLARTEEGWIERLTMVVYGIALLLCLAMALTLPWRFGIYPAILLLAAILRELDMDTFEGESGEQKLTSTRYWRSAEFPLLEKAIAAAALVGVLLALWRLARKGLPQLRNDLRKGRNYAFSVLGIAAFVLVSVILDNRVDTDSLDSPIVLYFSLVEELFELGIALLCCLALCQFWWVRRRGLHPGQT